MAIDYLMKQDRLSHILLSHYLHPLVIKYISLSIIIHTHLKLSSYSFTFFSQYHSTFQTRISLQYCHPHWLSLESVQKLNNFEGRSQTQWLNASIAFILELSQFLIYNKLQTQSAGQSMSLLHNRNISDQFKKTIEEYSTKRVPSSKIPTALTEPCQEPITNKSKWKIKQQFGQLGNRSSRPKVANRNLSRPEESVREYTANFHTEPAEISIDRSREVIGLNKNNRSNFLKIRHKSREEGGEWTGRSQRKSQSPPIRHIFTYLDRNYITSHKREIDDKAIARYAMQSTPRKLRMVEENSRRFLLNKMRSDYRQHQKVGEFRKAEMARLMEAQMKVKKRVFLGDYKKRGSSAYFSFLSLSREQQEGVRKRQAHNPETK